MERGLEIFDLVLIDSHPIQYQLEDELLMEITFYQVWVLKYHNWVWEK